MGTVFPWQLMNFQKSFFLVSLELCFHLSVEQRNFPAVGPSRWRSKVVSYWPCSSSCRSDTNAVSASVRAVKRMSPRCRIADRITNRFSTSCTHFYFFGIKDKEKICWTHQWKARLYKNTNSVSLHHQHLVSWKAFTCDLLTGNLKSNWYLAGKCTNKVIFYFLCFNVSHFNC